MERCSSRESNRLEVIHNVLSSCSIKVFDVFCISLKIAYQSNLRLQVQQPALFRWSTLSTFPFQPSYCQRCSDPHIQTYLQQTHRRYTILYLNTSPPFHTCARLLLQLLSRNHRNNNSRAMDIHNKLVKEERVRICIQLLVASSTTVPHRWVSKLERAR